MVLVRKYTSDIYFQLSKRSFDEPALTNYNHARVKPPMFWWSLVNPKNNPTLELRSMKPATMRPR
jgi:hypothetical protein